MLGLRLSRLPITSEIDNIQTRSQGRIISDWAKIRSNISSKNFLAQISYVTTFGRISSREGEVTSVAPVFTLVIDHGMECPVCSPLGGRHAAVIPALPEEFDSTMPLGAYYPSQRERERERERERDRERYRRTADDREPTPGSRSNPSPAPSLNGRSSPIKMDDYSPEHWTSNGASNGSPMRLHSSQSPALPPIRTESQSPALYREHSSPSQSYMSGPQVNGSARSFEANPTPPPPPPVPATFASIMNEYPLDPALALPSASAPPLEFVKADVGGNNGRETEFGSPNPGFTSQYQSNFPPGEGPER